MAAVLRSEHKAPPHLRAAVERDPSGPEPAREGKVGPTAPPVVLVAEDEPSVRASLTEILDLEGYKTVDAEDGETALQVLRSRYVDVLILDLQMPKLNGIALLHRIDAPPPVVVICSAFASYSPEEVRGAFGSKVFRMLRKPIPPAELISTVSEAVAEL